MSYFASLDQRNEGAESWERLMRRHAPHFFIEFKRPALMSSLRHPLIRHEFVKNRFMVPFDGAQAAHQERDGVDGSSSSQPFFVIP
jgi:hypothetical protein